MSPRCGKPMRRFEAVNGATPEEPECARPEGHNGMCRSKPGLARKYRKDAARIAAARRAGRYKRRRVAVAAERVA